MEFRPEDDTKCDIFICQLPYYAIISTKCDTVTPRMLFWKKIWIIFQMHLKYNQSDTNKKQKPWRGWCSDKKLGKKIFNWLSCKDIKYWMLRSFLLIQSTYLKSIIQWVIYWLNNIISSLISDINNVQSNTHIYIHALYLVDKPRLLSLHESLLFILCSIVS